MLVGVCGKSDPSEGRGGLPSRALCCRFQNGGNCWGEGGGEDLWMCRACVPVQHRGYNINIVIDDGDGSILISQLCLCIVFRGLMRFCRCSLTS